MNANNTVFLDSTRLSLVGWIDNHYAGGESLSAQEFDRMLELYRHCKIEQKKRVDLLTAVDNAAEDISKEEWLLRCAAHWELIQEIPDGTSYEWATITLSTQDLFSPYRNDPEGAAENQIKNIDRIVSNAANTKEQA